MSTVEILWVVIVFGILGCMGIMLALSLIRQRHVRGQQWLDRLEEPLEALREAMISMLRPEWWTERDCEALDCLLLAENWAISGDGCEGCYCAWHMLAPQTGEIAGVCEHLLLDGPDEASGQQLEGELAYVWALYSSGTHEETCDDEPPT